MKKICHLLVLGMLTPMILWSQSNREEVEFYQSIFGMEKKALVAEFVKVEGEAKDAFWSLYDQYERERKVLGQNRIALLQNYADNYFQLDDTKINELMRNAIKQKANLDKLLTKYYKKVKTASGSQAAAQFWQIESYILSAIRVEIFENIPLIGELD